MAISVVLANGTSYALILFLLTGLGAKKRKGRRKGGNKGGREGEREGGVKGNKNILTHWPTNSSQVANVYIMRKVVAISWPVRIKFYEGIGFEWIDSTNLNNSNDSMNPLFLSLFLIHLSLLI